MLNQMIDDKVIEARAIVAFYPANMVDNEDIEIYEDDETREKPLGKFFTLR